MKRDVRDTAALIALIRDEITGQGLSIDYVAAVDPTTFVPVDRVAGPTVLAVAARVGKTRLIDNVVVD